MQYLIHENLWFATKVLPTSRRLSAVSGRATGNSFLRRSARQASLLQTSSSLDMLLGASSVPPTFRYLFELEPSRLREPEIQKCIQVVEFCIINFNYYYDICNFFSKSIFFTVTHLTCLWAHCVCTSLWSTKRSWFCNQYDCWNGNRMFSEWPTLLHYNSVTWFSKISSSHWSSTGPHWHFLFRFGLIAWFKNLLIK